MIEPLDSKKDNVNAFHGNDTLRAVVSPGRKLRSVRPGETTARKHYNWADVT